MTPPGPGAPRPPKAPKVLLVQRSRLDPTTARRVAELRAEVERLGMTLSVRLAEDVHIGPASRPPTGVLKPADAADMYRRAHHGPLLVCAVEQLYVRTDPSTHPRSHTDLLPLGVFLAHKACFSLIGGRADTAALGDAFEEWQRSCECTGMGDPRTLPLHVFDAGRAWPELVEAQGRAAFNRAFGSPGSRVDVAKRRWAKAAALHGRDVAHVAGHALPAGSHWDVGFGRRGQLVSAGQVWAVPRNSYINVYPDGGVRGGSSDVPPAKLIWPRPGRSR